MALWQRKFGRAPASMQERARQIRFLAARGFSAATIGRVLSTTIDAD
jgi:regulatory protein